MVRRSRFVWVAVLSVLTGALAAAAVAWACTPQANIFLSTASARAGQTVGGHGVGFGAANTPGVTAVEIHFNSLSGNVLWSGSADASGSFTFSFAVPSVAPGYYVIVAQRPTVPDEAYRAVLQVLAPPSPAPHHAAPAPIHSRAPALRHHATAPPAPRPSTVTVTARASTPALTRAAATPAVVSSAPGAKRAVPRARRLVSHRHRAALTPATVPAASPNVFRAAPRARVITHASGIPWYLLAVAALALLLIGGAGGAFLAARRRPRAPLGVTAAELPPPVDPVEAELQRMLVDDGSAPTQHEPTLPDRH